MDEGTGIGMGKRGVIGGGGRSGITPDAPLVWTGRREMGAEVVGGTW